MSQNPQNPYDPNQYGQPGQYGQPDPYAQNPQAGYGAPGVPLGYGGYPNPAAPRRPTSVTVLAIIGIIIGILGVCGSIYNIATMFVHIGPSNAVVDALNANTAFRALSLVQVVLGLVFNVILLASSIGALSLKPWANKGLLLYAVAAIILGVLGGVILAVLLPGLLAPFANSSDPGIRMAVRVMIPSAVIGAVLGMIYPIFVLVYMRKPHVVAAFESASGGGNPGFPPGYNPNYPGGGYPGAGV